MTQRAQMWGTTNGVHRLVPAGRIGVGMEIPSAVRRCGPFSSLCPSVSSVVKESDVPDAGNVAPPGTRHFHSLALIPLPMVHPDAYPDADARLRDHPTFVACSGWAIPEARDERALSVRSGRFSPALFEHFDGWKIPEEV